MRSYSPVCTQHTPPTPPSESPGKVGCRLRGPLFPLPREAREEEAPAAARGRDASRPSSRLLLATQGSLDSREVVMLGSPRVDKTRMSEV